MLQLVVPKIEATEERQAEEAFAKLCRREAASEDSPGWSEAKPRVITKF